MAAQSGREDPPLESELFGEGYRFDFFEAVRLLEQLYPEREPVGRDASPAREVARFAAHLSLAFPASAIHEIVEPDPDRGPARLTVSFLGLTGPLGALPRHYTEWLSERVRQKDRALRDFLDLFNHRIVSLFHRAWEKYRFAIQFERALRKPERAREDRFTHHLYDLFGMGTKGLLGRLDVPDAALLPYAGLVGRQARSAAALEGMLRDHFGVEVKVVQFVGGWLALPEGCRTRLGVGEGPGALGVDTVAGSRVWDQQARFRVRIGPVGLARFVHFLPSGSAFRPLVQLTRFFAGQAIDFEVQLVLSGAEVPPCRLGETGERAARLGWSAWIGRRPPGRDAGEAVFGGGWTRLGALPG